MKKYNMNLLIEKPQDIESISIESLENDKLNQKEYHATTKSRKYKFVYNYNQNNIYELYIADNLILEAINHRSQRIDYLSKLEIQSIDFIKDEFVTQVIVWRNIHNPNVKGIALSVMLNYLLPKYKNIMCDEMRTELGKNLWLEFIAICYQHKLHVYFINFETKTINKLLTHRDFINLYQSNECPWNSKENYKKYRILISTTVQ